MTNFDLYLACLAVVYFAMWLLALKEINAKSKTISRLQRELNHAQGCIRILEKTR